MNFKFYPIESRIYDFLEFPRLIYYKEDMEGYKKEQNYYELIADEYLHFITKAEDKLKPYSKEIETFYEKQYLNKYDFIFLISKAYSIFNYKSETDYLNMLLNLNEHDIKRSIIYSIIAIYQEYDDYSDEVMKKAEEISSENNEMLSFIKDLPIDAGCKWNLFLIVENPLKYIKMYFELMTKLLPIFNDIYAPFEEEINSYGNYLVDYLNKNGTQGLEEITYSILDYNILENESSNILISVMFSYTLSIASAVQIKYIAWGLRMEEAFRKMKEINENKTIKRVQIFKNLGDKTRYEALKLIASGQTSTKVIANALGVSSATISYHISSFLNSKIIKMDKKDNKIGYVVDYKLLDETIEDFKEDLNFPELLLKSKIISS